MNDLNEDYLLKLYNIKGGQEIFQNQNDSLLAPPNDSLSEEPPSQQNPRNITESNLLELYNNNENNDSLLNMSQDSLVDFIVRNESRNTNDTFVGGETDFDMDQPPPNNNQPKELKKQNYLTNYFLDDRFVLNKNDIEEFNYENDYNYKNTNEPKGLKQYINEQNEIINNNLTLVDDKTTFLKDDELTHKQFVKGIQSNSQLVEIRLPNAKLTVNFFDNSPLEVLFTKNNLQILEINFEKGYRFITIFEKMLKHKNSNNIKSLIFTSMLLTRRKDDLVKTIQYKNDFYEMFHSRLESFTVYQTSTSNLLQYMITLPKLKHLRIYNVSNIDLVHLIRAKMFKISNNNNIITFEFTKGVGIRNSRYLQSNILHAKHKSIPMFDDLLLPFIKNYFKITKQYMSEYSIEKTPNNQIKKIIYKPNNVELFNELDHFEGTLDTLRISDASDRMFLNTDNYRNLNIFSKDFPFKNIEYYNNSYLGLFNPDGNNINNYLKRFKENDPLIKQWKDNKFINRKNTLLLTKEKRTLTHIFKLKKLGMSYLQLDAFDGDENRIYFNNVNHLIIYNYVEKHQVFDTGYISTSAGAKRKNINDAKKKETKAIKIADHYYIPQSTYNLYDYMSNLNVITLLKSYNVEYMHNRKFLTHLIQNKYAHQNLKELTLVLDPEIDDYHDLRLLCSSNTVLSKCHELHTLKLIFNGTLNVRNVTNINFDYGKVKNFHLIIETNNTSFFGKIINTKNKNQFYKMIKNVFFNSNIKTFKVDTILNFKKLTEYEDKLKTKQDDDIFNNVSIIEKLGKKIQKERKELNDNIFRITEEQNLEQFQTSNSTIEHLKLSNVIIEQNFLEKLKELKTIDFRNVIVKPKEGKIWDFKTKTFPNLQSFYFHNDELITKIVRNEFNGIRVSKSLGNHEIKLDFSSNIVIKTLF